jgi:hypothetical protein
MQELTRLLPYALRDKFQYHFDYVHDRLVDIAMEEGMHHRIKEYQDNVDLIFLLRLLYAYFVIGFHNHDQMLRFFESKQISGFQIGSTAFTRQSSITSEWREVAGELEALVRVTGLSLYVRPTLSIDEVLRRIVRNSPEDIAGTE